MWGRGLMGGWVGKLRRVALLGLRMGGKKGGGFCVDIVGGFEIDLY